MSPPYEFLCPYCFATIRDDEVMFRSAKANDAKPVAQSVFVSNAQELVDKALPEDLPVEETEEEELLSYLRAHILKQLEKGKPVTPEDLYPNYGNDDYGDYDGEPYDDWTDFIHNFPDGALKDHLRDLHNDMSVFGEAAGGASAPSGGGDAFFDLADDPEYTAFWKKYSTEETVNRAGETTSSLDPTPWRRRILDPANPLHQTYLQAQSDGGYFIRDADDMVARIQLKEEYGGKICSTRVCPKCHNPLPTNYGKIPVKFLTIIGITGSGKTVYLSRLFQDMSTYMSKVRIVVQTTPSVNQFLLDNPVRNDEPLSPITMPTLLHQPLFFNLTRSDNQDSESDEIKMVETLITYDVSGECFQDTQESEQYLEFAPFIEHSHGIMLLIDPNQIEHFVQSGKVGEKRYQPSIALQRIHNILTNGAVYKKCHTPVAVCISKMDELTGDNETQNSIEIRKPNPKPKGLLPPDLSKLLKTPIEGFRDPATGFFSPLFNAQAYNPIFKGLYSFFQEYDPPLAQYVDTFYLDYAYFAFTALGCRVDKDTRIPLHPIHPYRIEEPLLWLFERFGYISASEPIEYPYKGEFPGFNQVEPWSNDKEEPKNAIFCPHCGGTQSNVLPYEDRLEWHGLFGWFFSLFRIQKSCNYYNRQCTVCGRKFMDEGTHRREQQIGALEA